MNIKKNKVYIGYNLRFHPGIIFLKKLLKKKQPIDIKIITNSYLPNWRKGNYKHSYSANKKKGGGVILDLSHEIDLALWLFGNIKIMYLKFGRKSNLRITSEDYLKLMGKIKNANFYLDLSYYSKNETRSISVDTNQVSINLDLKNNFIKIDNKIKFFLSHNHDLTYLNLHKAIILKKNTRYLCTFDQGKEVLRMIKEIKKIRSF